MFFRVKGNGGREYLQIAESYRDGEKVRQRIVATLGRLDVLQATGQLDRLLRSGLRFSKRLRVLDAHAAGETKPVAITKIGPDLVFGRLWSQAGLKGIVCEALSHRRYEFDVERAVYLTVLHRLFAGGSDRAAEVWKENYHIPGTEPLALQHLYRAMAWLGEEIAEGELGAARCTKDLIEEALFEQGRDLFSEVGLVFFDTTSIYFERRGGQSIGRRGHSPAAAGWPGNTTDSKSLRPVVERMRAKFRVREICVVADRGMVSEATLEALTQMEPAVHYIVGARECGEPRRLAKSCSKVTLPGRRLHRSDSVQKIPLR